MLIRTLESKPSILRSDLCDYSGAYMLQKELLLLLIQIMQKEIKQQYLKIMHHLSTEFQKLMA